MTAVPVLTRWTDGVLINRQTAMLAKPWIRDTLTSMLEGWALRMLQVLRPSLVGAEMRWEWGGGGGGGGARSYLHTAVHGHLGYT